MTYAYLLTHYQFDVRIIFMDIQSQSCHKSTHRVRVAAGGRLVIPAEVRQELGIKEGDEVLLSRDEGGIRIATLKDTVHEVQEYFRQLKKPGESVVDELIRDREREATQEAREFRGRKK